MNTLVKFGMCSLKSRQPSALLMGTFVLIGVFALSACVSGPEALIDPPVADGTTAQNIIAGAVRGDEGMLPATSDAVSEKEDSPADAGWDLTAGTVDEVEAAGLIFMREEEKLARDVYMTMYDTWGLAIFKNIAASEQSHTDAVKAVLARYGLSDPVVDEAIGQFVNPELQALYDRLVAQGRLSLVEALRVGAAIEEIDILDLQERLAQTDDVGIQQLYGNLLKGSENHLRAFVSQLERQAGETYAPEYLAQSDYEAIVFAISGPGARGVRGGNGQNGRNGRNGY